MIYYSGFSISVLLLFEFSVRTIFLHSPSGQGKSTICKLLFRMYDVSGGRILIGTRYLYTDCHDKKSTLLSLSIFQLFFSVSFSFCHSHDHSRTQMELIFGM